MPLLLKPGDVVFMHPHLIHGSDSNTSDKRRLMFINGFSYPGANHKPYPGIGSAKRISLKTGQEVPEQEVALPRYIKVRISTSPYSLLKLKVELKPIANDELEPPLAQNNAPQV